MKNTDKYSPLLYGNRELLQMLLSAVSSGSLAHAYIFDGEEGTGKHTLALICCSALACGSPDSPCLECFDCKRILERNSPDIFFFGVPQGKKTIGVDVVRKIKELAYITPNELDFKAFVLENVELMTVEAQNSLLKLLEEPPKNVYFFLLAQSSANILPTVKSRAPVLRMETFSDDLCRAYILENSDYAKELYKSSADEFNFNIKASHGSIGALKKRFANEADENSDDNVKQVYGLIKSILKLMSESKNSDIISECTDMFKDRNEFESFLEAFMTALRDMLCSKLSDFDDFLFFNDFDSAFEYSEKFSVAELIGYYEHCEKCKTELKFNVNLSSAELIFALGLIKQK